MAAARRRFARTRGDQQQLTSGVSCRRLGARRPHSDATDVLGRAEPARVGADRPDRGQRREDIGREPRGESRPCHSSLVIGGELLLVRSSVSRRSATSSSSRESAARWRTRAAKRAMKPVEERGPREAAWHERSMSVRRLYTELGHYNSHTESFGVESLPWTDLIIVRVGRCVFRRHFSQTSAFLIAPGFCTSGARCRISSCVTTDLSSNRQHVTTARARPTKLETKRARSVRGRAPVPRPRRGAAPPFFYLRGPNTLTMRRDGMPIGTRGADRRRARCAARRPRPQTSGHPV